MTMQPLKNTRRREFLVLLSSCIAADAFATSANTNSQQITELMAVGNALAGTKVDSKELVGQYLQVLQEHLSRPQITAFLTLAKQPAKVQATASRQKPLKEAAEFALQLWLSAMPPIKNSETVLAYIDAPIWSTLTFTKPAGVCGGAFGYWADKPA
ncbi:hypothetical protein KUF54_08690 [Comamonas sp. Y33R10-2]|uniref:hypothetical protein n=1 Tax=Comamonas sp. Y33R10-2 TaxID=2853257 RepID=UPI001C5CB313|nr:hypothetical protein [Comamonas sp. Y33R10-2]QXZ08209.1 hypothetical protein KUF54_08690 [Comamonas sp. Y33R10-2]